MLCFLLPQGCYLVRLPAYKIYTCSYKQKLPQIRTLYPIFELGLKLIWVWSKILKADWYFSLFVPTFDTKVTENLCSGWVFFLQTNFDFLTSHFWWNFFISFKRYCCPELKLEKIFHLSSPVLRLPFWPFWPIWDN